MANKEQEAAFFRSLPPEALQRSLDKPFSVEGRVTLLMEIAAVIAQLPEPPARVLDLGCGTGWTSAFLARCGYDVVGVDLSTEAVDAASAHFAAPALRYRAHDFDRPLPAELGTFDAAVFFDALHHSADERLPLETAARALRPGGVCVICEPGRGHAHSEESQLASRTFGVRERDMSPDQVVAAARAAGFARTEVLPHPHEVSRALYLRRPGAAARDRVLATPAGKLAQLLRVTTVRRRHWGLVRATR